MTAALASTPINVPDFSSLLECRPCDGSGEELETDTCDTCDGDGHTLEWDDDAQADVEEQCYDCDGEGTVETTYSCDYCDGDGETRRDFENNAEATLEALAEALTIVRDSGLQVDFGENCCQSCAFSVADPDEDRGFIGFHTQDVEGLIERGQGLYLFHHLPTPAHADLVKLALATAGLTTTWDGSQSKRIYIEAVV